MSEFKWSILSLAASLVLAGLAIVFAGSLPYAAMLIGIAIVLVLGAAGWSAWEGIPRVLTDPKRAKETARSIYRRAAQQGGTIHATHIFPIDRSPEGDFAINELGKAGNDIKISLHRVLLLDSIEDERTWLKLLFHALGENIAKRFYTLSSYPLMLPRIVKAVLPRLNLILYQAPSGRACQVLVGLDRLHLAGVSVNFALHSRSRRVYQVLLNYFNRIAGSPHFRSFDHLDDYDATQAPSTQVRRGQAVVSRMVDYAETAKGVVFVGLFGSMARAVQGLTSEVVGDNDADVDIIVVFDPHIYVGTVTDLREGVESSLGAGRTHITWGPDLSVFYPFRVEKRINIDIECHPVGANFYMENRLLGSSIFRYFVPLYSVDQQAVVSYLQVPTTPLTPLRRLSLVVSDRQGLRYFKDRVAEFPPGTDPRRLCSHVLRNIVWAITGTWSTTGREAGEYLSLLPGWKNNPALNDAIRLLSFSAQEVGRDSRMTFSIVGAIIDCVQEYADSVMAES